MHGYFLEDVQTSTFNGSPVDGDLLSQEFYTSQVVITRLRSLKVGPGVKLLKTSCFFGKEKFLPIPQPPNLPVLTP